jgi:hypothetical protein
MQAQSKKKPEQRSMWQAPRCHAVQDHHSMIQSFHFNINAVQNKPSMRLKNNQKATKIQKFRHLL